LLTHHPPQPLLFPYTTLFRSAKNFIDSTLGSNGALLLKSRFQNATTGLLVPPKNVRNPGQPRRHSLVGISNAPEIMRISRQFADVASCSPVLRGTVSARAGFDNATVDLFGIDAAQHLQTTNLAQQITAGDLDDFRNNPNAVIVGSRLADALQVAPGDSIQLLSPGGEYRRFAIAATRSEERRVGKECRSRGARDRDKKKSPDPRH